MEVEIISIDPAKASEMLEKNTKNRNISATRLMQYAKDMKNNRWKESGNTISVGPDGRLLNGQHRLMALVEAGITMDFIVVTEDSDETFDIFDTGLNRNVAVLLRMHGIADASIVSGIAKMVQMYDSNPGNVWHASTLTKQELIEFAQAHKEEAEFYANLSTLFAYHIKCGKNWYAAGMYLISRDTKHSDKLDEFHKSLCEGVGMTSDDPRLAFRNYLIRQGAPHTMWEQQSYVGLLLRTWNDWIHGEKKTQVRWMRTSLPMPKVDADPSKAKTEKATTVRRTAAKKTAAKKTTATKTAKKSS